MVSFRSLWALLLSAALVTSVFSQLGDLGKNTTIDATLCVVPAEYTKCFNAAASGEAYCVSKATSDDDKTECGCLGSAARINCFGSACWNRVYGCEYQSIVFNYANSCPYAGLPAPFWPPPENAPGGCSCNIGALVNSASAAYIHGFACEENSAQGDDAHVSACSCCTQSVEISSYFDICPYTDPNIIGLDALMDIYRFDNWTSCASTLEKTDCVRSLGFAAPASTGSLYGPTNTPVRGTQTLFNNPGAVSTPISGSVYSWTAGGVNGTRINTVTVLSAEMKFVATTSTGPSSGSTTAPTKTEFGSSSIGVPATTSGVDAAQTSKTSGGVKSSPYNVSYFVRAMLAITLISCV